MQKKINEDIYPMCEGMIDRLVDGVAGRKAEVPGQLKRAAAEGPRQVEQHLSVLINNLVENLSADPEIKAKKDGIRKDVRALVEAWKVAWTEEGNYEEHILDLDLDIPDTVPEPLIEEALESDEDEDATDDTFDDDDDDYEDF